MKNIFYSIFMFLLLDYAAIDDTLFEFGQSMDENTQMPLGKKDFVGVSLCNNHFSDFCAFLLLLEKFFSFP